MNPIRARLAFLLALLAAPLATAQTGKTISLTVDATESPRKMLHAHLVIPVQPGPLTLYYPKWIPGEHGPAGPITSLTGLKFEAAGKTIPWLRDTLDVFTFHLDIPAGATHLDAQYDVIEPEGDSATDKLMVSGVERGRCSTPRARPPRSSPTRPRFCCPKAGSSAPRCLSPKPPAIKSRSSPSRSISSSTRL